MIDKIWCQSSKSLCLCGWSMAETSLVFCFVLLTRRKVDDIVHCFVMSTSYYCYVYSTYYRDSVLISHIKKNQQNWKQLNLVDTRLINTRGLEGLIRGFSQLFLASCYFISHPIFIFWLSQLKNLQSIFLTGVAIMLSITIFATIVGEMLPVSDATPLIG